MTIEIEAGASQNQFSMKPLVVHAFFDGQPGGLLLGRNQRAGCRQRPTGAFRFGAVAPLAMRGTVPGGSFQQSHIWVSQML